MTDGSPRRQSPAVRIEQVLDAAEAVLLERGLPDTTIAEIATRAGIGKGTVYLYFDSKPAVLAAIRRRYVEGIEAEVRTAASEADDREARLRAAVTRFVEASTRRVDLHHLLFHEAGFSEQDAFAPVRAAFADILGEGGKASGLTTDFVLGGIHAGIVAVAHAPKNRRREMTDRIAALAIQATYSPAPAD